MWAHDDKLLSIWTENQIRVRCIGHLYMDVHILIGRYCTSIKVLRKKSRMILRGEFNLFRFGRAIIIRALTQ